MAVFVSARICAVCRFRISHLVNLFHADETFQMVYADAANSKKIQLSSPFGSEQEKGAMFNCQLHVMWRKSEFHLTCMNTGKTSRFSPVQSECEYIKQPLSYVSEQTPLFSEPKGDKPFITSIVEDI